MTSAACTTGMASSEARANPGLSSGSTAEASSTLSATTFAAASSRAFMAFSAAHRARSASSS